VNLRELVERRIQEALDRGKLDNLSGEGAPLRIEENPFEDPETRMAYKVLSNAGYCPPWMDLMKDIDRDMARAQRTWDDYRTYRRRQMAGIHRGSVARFAELVTELDGMRNRTLRRLEERWADINKSIARLNAEVPSDSLSRTPLDIKTQRARFERDFPLLGGMMGERGTS
jgi:hypothetical protein